MKKIPTLFVRTYRGGRMATPEVVHGFEWVALGRGEATEKVDGAACAIIGGRFYKRYDAKAGKTPPKGAIPCQPKPSENGHWPHWVKVDKESNADRWFVNAYYNTPWAVEDGTYEAVGIHFQKNPYGLDDDYLEPHGRIKLKDCPRDYDGIREYLRTHEIEGIVFWLNGEPKCKIKRSDFGFEWPIKQTEAVK